MISLLAFVIPILPIFLLSIPCLIWSSRDVARLLNSERHPDVSAATLVNRAGRLGFRQMLLYFGLLGVLVLTAEALRPEMFQGMGYFWVFLSVPSIALGCFFARYWARSRLKSRLAVG